MNEGPLADRELIRLNRQSLLAKLRVVQGGDSTLMHVMLLVNAAETS